jgi:large subunit ribosomal protein L6
MGDSRIGKKPVLIPAGIKVAVAGNELVVRSADGKKELRQFFDMVSVAVVENTIVVKPLDETATAKARHGLYRSLFANMVQGIATGYERKLEVVGVGFKVEKAGKDLKLTVGFSQPVSFETPAGIEVEVPGATAIVVRGIDKQLVGETASRIRRIRPPEPYKGKGIRYANENVKKKVAKGK